jgi:hypothetical protein
MSNLSQTYPINVTKTQHKENKKVKVLNERLDEDEKKVSNFFLQVFISSLLTFEEEARVFVT